MSDPKAPTDEPALPVGGNHQAPFIYFDAVSTYGALAGGIQIELAAITLLPAANGGTTNEFVVTGHLRCNMNGLMHLKNSIDKVLGFMQSPQTPEAQAGSGRLN